MGTWEIMRAAYHEKLLTHERRNHECLRTMERGKMVMEHHIRELEEALAASTKFHEDLTATLASSKLVREALAKEIRRLQAEMPRLAQGGN